MVKVYMFEVRKSGHMGKSNIGVVFDGNALTTSEMQEVAMKTGFTQTIFIVKSKLADIRLRYFTPIREVNAGIDGTMAIVHALEKSPFSINKEVITTETNVGIFPLQLFKYSKKEKKAKQLASHSFNECKSASYSYGATRDPVLQVLNGCAVDGVTESGLPKRNMVQSHEKTYPAVDQAVHYLNIKEAKVPTSLFASSFFLITANNIRRYKNEMFTEKLNMKAECRLRNENVSIVRILMNAPHIARPIETEGMTFYLGQRLIPISN